MEEDSFVKAGKPEPFMLLSLRLQEFPNPS